MSRLAIIGALSALFLVLAPLPVSAYDAGGVCSSGAALAGCEVVKDDRLQSTSSNPLIKNVLNTLFYLVGALATVFIIIGGVRYAASQGNSSAVTSAKNTILYAVIGLVVAFASYAVVNFIIQWTT